MGESLRISSKKLPKDHFHCKIPPSKSHTLRALLFAALIKGPSEIKNYLPSPDTSHLLTSIEALGGVITPLQEGIKIYGGYPWNKVAKPIYVGNSGILLRFLTAMLSLSENRYVIEGDPYLTAMRPAEDLLQGLKQLGATYQYLGEYGKAPFVIQGPIKGGRVFLKGEDSQPISALLIVLGFLGHGEILVENPKEIPWIKMTLHWLDRLGCKVKVSSDFKKFEIIQGIISESFSFTIPSDYSSLAYPFSLSMVLEQPLKLGYFTEIFDEGDAAFLRHAEMTLGCRYSLGDGLLIPSSNWNWNVNRINLEDCIDLVSLFTVLATRSDKRIEICGIEGAKNKECNRLVAIKEELSKMGGKIYLKDDKLIIDPSRLKGTKLFSWHDHRMVFALSIAAMMAEGESIIENASCIVKSYPNYVETMQEWGLDWEWI